MRKTGEQMAKELIDWVNSATSSEFDQFAKQIVKEHRTLQHETFDLFVRCMEQWAELYQKDWYDPRNEWACRMSYEIINKCLT